MGTLAERSAIPHPLKIAGWRRISPIHLLHIVGGSRDFCRDWHIINLRHLESLLNEQEIQKRLRGHFLRG